MSKPHRLDCLLSFAATFLVMSLVLLVRGCAPFGDISLAFEDGNINIYKNNKLIEQKTVESFSRSPNAVFRLLQKSIVGELLPM